MEEVVVYRVRHLIEDISDQDIATKPKPSSFFNALKTIQDLFETNLNKEKFNMILSLKLIVF